MHQGVAQTGDHAARIRRLAALSRLLDDSFGIPGTRWRFGLDGLLGLIPGAGDAATAVLSAYIINEARKLGVRRGTLARMLGNLAVDVAVGAVPVIGDLFDVAFKANRRNMRLLVRELRKTGAMRQ